MTKSFLTRHTCLAATAAVVVAASVAEAKAQANPTQVVESIQRYCSASWRNARIARHDWTDCTQEVWAEILGRIGSQKLGRAIGDAQSDERRELNRSIWCVIQRKRRDARRFTTSDDFGDLASPDPAQGGELRDILKNSADTLTERQVKILRRLGDGHTVAEIASELKTSPARVSDEKYRAVRKLRDKFRTNV